MKKPSKPAAKKGATKPAPKKAAPAAKKPAAKAAPKKVVKPAPKKAVPAKKALPAKKPVAKVLAKKPLAKKPDVKGKSQAGLQKKIQDKIAASKKAHAEVNAKKFAVKNAKKMAEDKKKSAKALELQKKNEKQNREKEKLAAKASKESEKEAAKAAKLAAKEAAKPPKKLSKKEEKELLKAKKKGGSFEEDQEEEANTRRPSDEDEEDDELLDKAPKKVKMTFDEDIEEEIIPVRKKSKSAIDDDIKENLAEEILALSDDFSIDEVFASIRSMELFKVETDECVVRGCDNPSTTSGYCRYHYIKLWKDVKKKQLILSEGRLAKIIEELVGKYPMKYIETIIQDLADDKAFNHVLKDLDIETDEAEIDGFDDDELLDDDQDIAFETKVVKPSFDD